MNGSRGVAGLVVIIIIIIIIIMNNWGVAPHNLLATNGGTHTHMAPNRDVASRRRHTVWVAHTHD